MKITVKILLNVHDTSVEQYISGDSDSDKGILKSLQFVWLKDIYNYTYNYSLYNYPYYLISVLSIVMAIL